MPQLQKRERKERAGWENMSRKKVLEKENLTEPAIAYILTRKDEDIRNLKAEDLAASLKIDLDQLSALFEKEQKISIPVFIEREKICRAYFVLHKGLDIAIPELSERLGFASSALFEKSFEKYIFIKPGKYKELIKQMKNREPVPAQKKPRIVEKIP
jgi:AraC-like DNA-binding protein